MSDYSSVAPPQTTQQNFSQSTAFAAALQRAKQVAYRRLPHPKIRSLLISSPFFFLSVKTQTLRKCDCRSMIDCKSRFISVQTDRSQDPSKRTRPTRYEKDW